MIVVTGATGKLGKLIVEALLSRVSPSEIGVSVRDPEKAEAFEQKGVRVRRGDFHSLTRLRVPLRGLRNF